MQAANVLEQTYQKNQTLYVCVNGGSAVISSTFVWEHTKKTLANLGDALLTISASGVLENVVKAATWARENKMEAISFTGFEGGRMADLATVHLHVEANN